MEIFRKQISRKSISSLEPKIWNGLDRNIKIFTSASSYRHALKNLGFFNTIMILLLLLLLLRKLLLPLLVLLVIFIYLHIHLYIYIYTVELMLLKL